MTSYAAYLFPFLGIRRLIQVLKHGIPIRLFFNDVFRVLILSTILGFVSIAFNHAMRHKSLTKFEKHKQHSVIGLAAMAEMNRSEEKLFDHRVVSVNDRAATNWDYSTSMHWEHIDQDVVNQMVSRGVMALTRTTDPVDAWSALIPYQDGEAVAIKVNFNNTWNYDEADNDHDAFPETVNAVLDGLVSIGVPVDRIWITDPSRVIPDRFRDRIKYDGVRYYSALYTAYRPDVYLTSYVDPDSPEATPVENPPSEVVRPAQVFVDAHHLINIPMLKGHGPSWVTLGLKNHFGSVFFKDHERNEMHQYIYPNTADPNTNPLGDISNNPHIRDKTRLVLGDGLFGNPLLNYTPLVRWQIFDDDSPDLLFFGVDPIATESVMLDYLNEELIRIGRTPVNDDYLHYAASLGLGIHEHWDDFSTKAYDAIDYVEIHVGDTATPEESYFPPPSGFSISQNYPNPFNGQTTMTYRVPGACRVFIKIYNVLGKEIFFVMDEPKEEGTYRIHWNGDDEKGDKVTSGIYYYQMISGEYRNTKKMLLLR